MVCSVSRVLTCIFIGRLPIDAGDPALALPRIDKWLALLKELNGFDASDKYALFSSENAA